MFKEALLKTTASKETRTNTVSDGKYSCAYQELPGIFAAFDGFFADTGVATEDCSMVRCGNSLPEAVLLLWMLYKRKDFVLLPRVGTGKKERREIEVAQLPEFCRHTVSVSMPPDSLKPDIKKPASYINIEANPNSREDARIPAGSGKVFLRTSGSTAEPKLVMHSNKKLVGNAVNCAERLELHHDRRIIIPVPLFHMYGLGAGFLPGVIVGASIHLVANTNVIKYLDREKQFNPGVSFMTPPLCEMLLRTRKTPYHYQLVVTAGDRIGRKSFEDFEKKFGKLINLYGSTELGVIATSRLNDPLHLRSHGVIEPLPGVEICLETLEAVNEESEEEKSGMFEIVCSHDYGLEAYVDKKGQIISREQDITRFKTRDLGKWVGRDTFKVIGRTGNSINRNGILVAFSEVESLMEQGIEEIAHAVVLATGEGEKSYRGKRLAAYCQLKPGLETSDKEIRSRCFNIMMRHMVPDEVAVVKELPRLPNGKFDRKKLKEEK